jgi:hypothetical protein
MASDKRAKRLVAGQQTVCAAWMSVPARPIPLFLSLNALLVAGFQMAVCLQPVCEDLGHKRADRPGICFGCSLQRSLRLLGKPEGDL